MSVVKKLRAARLDLVDIFYHYASEGSLPTARRFLVQAAATFQRLAGMPGLGARYEPDDARYADLRYFPVSRFRMYLVFYRPIVGGIEVFRVLHGARDNQGILADEFGGEEGSDDQPAQETE